MSTQGPLEVNLKRDLFIHSDVLIFAEFTHSQLTLNLTESSDQNAPSLTVESTASWLFSQSIFKGSVIFFDAYSILEQCMWLRFKSTRANNGNCSSFQTDEDENTFRFSNGDGPIRYTIVNFQKNSDNRTYSWRKVGNYSCKCKYLSYNIIK